MIVANSNLVTSESASAATLFGDSISRGFQVADQAHNHNSDYGSDQARHRGASPHAGSGGPARNYLFDQMGLCGRNRRRVVCFHFVEPAFKLARELTIRG